MTDEGVLSLMKGLALGVEYASYQEYRRLHPDENRCMLEFHRYIPGSDNTEDYIFRQISEHHAMLYGVLDHDYMHMEAVATIVLLPEQQKVLVPDMRYHMKLYYDYKRVIQGSMRSCKNTPLDLEYVVRKFIGNRAYHIHLGGTPEDTPFRLTDHDMQDMEKFYHEACTGSYPWNQVINIRCQ